LEYIQNLGQLAQKIKAAAQLRQGRSQALELHLSPPRLGGLQMRVQMQGEEMRIFIGAEREAAVNLVREMRSDLAQIVADQGYELKQCDVGYQSLTDHRFGMNNAALTERQRHDPPSPIHSTPALAELSDEAGEEPPRALDLGYNTLDLVA
jgi:flagellar hook-length control protein FliK